MGLASGVAVVGTIAGLVTAIRQQKPSGAGAMVIEQFPGREQRTAQTLNMTEDDDVLIALTERQEQVLDYIDYCITKDHMPPTREEIAAKLDLWPSSVADILRTLAKKGRITLIPNVSRGIKLVAL